MSKLQIIIIYTLIVFVIIAVKLPKKETQKTVDSSMEKFIHLYYFLEDIIENLEVESLEKVRKMNAERSILKKNKNHSKLTLLNQKMEKITLLFNNSKQVIDKLDEIRDEVAGIGGYWTQGKDASKIVNYPHSKHLVYESLIREDKASTIKKIVNNHINWVKKLGEEWDINYTSPTIRNIYSINPEKQPCQFDFSNHRLYLQLPALDPKDNPIYENLSVPTLMSKTYEEVAFENATVIEVLVEIQRLKIHIWYHTWLFSKYI